MLSWFWVMWLAPTSRSRIWRCIGQLSHTPRVEVFLKIMWAASKTSPPVNWLEAKWRMRRSRGTSWPREA